MKYLWLLILLAGCADPPQPPHPKPRPVVGVKPGLEADPFWLSRAKYCLDNAELEPPLTQAQRAQYNLAAELERALGRSHPGTDWLYLAGTILDGYARAQGL